MAVNQEENLFSSGIKFDNEGFLERCQITERENPKRFDDSLLDQNPMNLRGDSFDMGRKTKETSEAVKDVDEDNKKVGFLPFGFERYWKSWCNFVHHEIRKGLEKHKLAQFSVHVNDPIPWRNIHIEHPLNDKITDDDLLRMTNLAQGTLHSLSLVECRKITATCLRRILLSNPGLYEVSVVLMGETMILNTEGYFGERCPGMRIDLNLPPDDSQSEISSADDDNSATDKVHEDFFTDDDPFGLGISSQSQMQCEDIAAALPPTDFFGI